MVMSIRSFWATAFMLLAGAVLWANQVSADDAPAGIPKDLKEVAKEIQARVAKDQAARKAFTDWTKKNGQPNDPKITLAQKAEFLAKAGEMNKIDQDNTAWMKKVVDLHGWLSASKVGAEAASSAWLMVQHADKDPKFQRKCLDLMADLPPGEIKPSDLALLTDRVLLAEGKKQLYGSQFMTKDGKWLPRPIEDEAHVDDRRKKVGLPPLAEYAKILEQVYGKP